MNTRRPFPLPEPSPSAPSDPLAALALLAAEGEALDLGRAALLIAAAHYEAFDLDKYLQRLDTLAAEAGKRIGRVRKPERVVAILNAYLYEECGFHGNRDDYYNPANSFLNEVLDCRAGLPITLSVLTIALAERLGLPIVGVGMPLHFLVKYVASRRDILLDPFYGGEILTPEGCQQRLEAILNRPVVFEPSFLHATPKPQILYRLLNNLKQVYLRREEPKRAGRVVEQMLAVLPSATDNLRDRGLLYLQENALSQGAAWLQRYLETVPDAPDAEEVRRAIGKAYARRALLN